MNKKPTNKPFGLTLATVIAAQAIKEEVAPVSIILGNLLYLQKSNVFPKNLDTHFFSFAKSQSSEEDKRTIGLILPNLRRPIDSVSEMLESYIADKWVIKKAPAPVKTVKATPTKKVVKAKHVPKKESVAPTITVKKSKLI